MLTLGTIKVIGLVTAGAGAAASLVSGWLDDKKQDLIIEEKVKAGIESYFQDHSMNNEEESF